MKNFTHNNELSGLHANACSWLVQMGLRETRWILDTEWFLDHYNGTVTYHDWIKEK